MLVECSAVSALPRRWPRPCFSLPRMRHRTLSVRKSSSTVGRPARRWVHRYIADIEDLRLAQEGIRPSGVAGHAGDA
jgi:hypothetical protein